MFFLKQVFLNCFVAFPVCNIACYHGPGLKILSKNRWMHFKLIKLEAFFHFQKSFLQSGRWPSKSQFRGLRRRTPKTTREEVPARTRDTLSNSRLFIRRRTKDRRRWPEGRESSFWFLGPVFWGCRMSPSGRRPRSCTGRCCHTQQSR